jgi:penicillin-binding protein 2
VALLGGAGWYVWEYGLRDYQRHRIRHMLKDDGMRYKPPKIRYKDHTKTNYYEKEVLLASRGLIYDRNKNLLAGNRDIHNLHFIPAIQGCTMPQDAKSKQDCVRNFLYDLKNKTQISMSARKHKKLIDDFGKRSVNYPSSWDVMIKRKLSTIEVKQVRQYIQKNNIKSLNLIKQQGRHYPYAKLFSHTLGHTYPDWNSPLRSSSRTIKLNRMQTDYKGIRGIEARYDKLLRGTPGVVDVERNKWLQFVDQKILTPAKPGENLHLTLDLKLQQLAYKALGDTAGAVVALDPNTGQVLVSVSKPGYDTNNPADTVNRQHWRNRYLHNAYPPGSTIKPFMALAGLHNNIDAARKINCQGYFALPGVKHRWRDWKKGGHGKVNMQQAITQSCDVYFYTLAVKLRIQRISSMLGHFGVGSPTGIDLPREYAGYLPSPDWKRKRFKKPVQQKWYTGDTISIGVGQGYIIMTPMQMAVATGVIATRGTRIKPYLLHARKVPGSTDLQYTKPVITNKLVHIKKDHWKTVIDGMKDSMKRYHKGNYSIAGKTGVAPILFKKQTGDPGKPFTVTHIPLFIGFAPADKPTIAIAVVTEHQDTSAVRLGLKIIEAHLKQTAP